MKRRTQYEKHGMSHSPEYSSWEGMIGRCRNMSDPRWASYGGRGIKVCDQWLSFIGFLADMGQRPEGTWLERINNDGDYTPTNCKWATRAEQMSNTRRNCYIAHDGMSLTVSEWARRLRVNKSTIHKRIARGWNPEDALQPRRWERKVSNA